nr:immunoglobulin heavy chain junction region [Macaca mulatta]MOX59999.1 immunoglobulin heavy chain junction region [Macaca mulatta]MOX68053.1 immunoglobulin heavy chain junction region [Macaca mulatta]
CAKDYVSYSDSGYYDLQVPYYGLDSW